MDLHALPFPVTTTVTTPELLWIPALPLAAFVLLILAGRRLGRVSAWIAVAALAAACVMTLRLAGDVFRGDRLAVSWTWLSATDPRWTIGFLVDGLSWIMLVVVTGIGTMIALYSIGYMHDDPRFSRFFAYFSLFCTAMLTLVLADHFVLLFVGWELVGLCSFLLIGFWFEKPAAVAASRKAFLTTRVGDTGLVLGIFMLAAAGADLHFDALSGLHATHPAGWLTLVSTLIFFGAVGKSAQIPLHVWLPDAMEGPTPVSALIHAATMVAAGVYLVARTLPLFTPESLHTVLAIGLATHLFAGTVALAMTDIKRILAYSTLSQLGLMMAALGIGAASAAMFHLVTHAFFKALLFLGAGSVIHATHEQELAHLGGLRRKMPWTSTLFLIASLSMGGTFLLSGFWSKDAILLAARERSPWLMWVLLGGAATTACYIFRLYLRCFHGEEREVKHGPRLRGAHIHAAQKGHKVHESPFIMTFPMTMLGIGASCIGLVESPWLGHPLFHLVGDPHVHERIDPFVAVLSTASLAVGVALAWVVGFKRRNLLPTALRPLGAKLYQLAANKYYVDELYGACIIRPFLAATRALSGFDQRVIDGAVNGAGAIGWWLGQVKAEFDRQVIDRIVNGIAQVTRGIGSTIRWIQTGFIQHYLFIVVVSVIMLSAILRR